MASKIEQLTNKTVEEGGMLTVLYFDVIGKDKQKVEQLLVDLVTRLNSEQGVVYCVGDIQRAIELESKDFSAAAKVTVLTRSFAVLSRICDNYGPIGLEIIKPHEVKMSVADAQSVILDHVHQTSSLLKEIVEKTMTPEERSKLGRILEARAERGKEIISKGGQQGHEHPKGKKE